MKPKPFIAIIPDVYFGYAVMVANCRPWIKIGDNWVFQATSFEVHLMCVYQSFLTRNLRGQLNE